MLQIGKTYEFKTFTFYYIGTVSKIYPTHVELNNVWEVFQTGPNSEFFTGKIKEKEQCPDGTLLALSPGVNIFPYDNIKII